MDNIQHHHPTLHPVGRMPLLKDIFNIGGFDQVSGRLWDGYRRSVNRRGKSLPKEESSKEPEKQNEPKPPQPLEQQRNPLPHHENVPPSTKLTKYEGPSESPQMPSLESENKPPATTEATSQPPESKRNWEVEYKREERAAVAKAREFVGHVISQEPVTDKEIETFANGMYYLDEETIAQIALDVGVPLEEIGDDNFELRRAIIARAASNDSSQGKFQTLLNIPGLDAGDFDILFGVQYGARSWTDILEYTMEMDPKRVLDIAAALGIPKLPNLEDLIEDAGVQERLAWAITQRLRGDTSLPQVSPDRPLGATPTHQSVVDRFHSVIQESYLTPNVKEEYRRSTQRVLGTMPEKALSLMNESIHKIVFAGERNEIQILWSQRNQQEEAPKGLYGFYGTEDGLLAISPGAELRIDEIDPEEKGGLDGFLAHEIAHAIDCVPGTAPPGQRHPTPRFSSLEEWQEAHATEVVPKEGRTPLSYYAVQSAIESFAEFHRLLAGSNVPLTTIAKQFPKCLAFFQKHGLWHPPEQARLPYTKSLPTTTPQNVEHHRSPLSFIGSLLHTIQQGASITGNQKQRVAAALHQLTDHQLNWVARELTLPPNANRNVLLRIVQETLTGRGDTSVEQEPNPQVLQRVNLPRDSPLYPNEVRQALDAYQSGDRIPDNLLANLPDKLKELDDLQLKDIQRQLSLGGSYPSKTSAAMAITLTLANRNPTVASVGNAALRPADTRYEQPVKKTDTTSLPTYLQKWIEALRTGKLDAKELANLASYAELQALSSTLGIHIQDTTPRQQRHVSSNHKRQLAESISAALHV